MDHAFLGTSSSLVAVVFCLILGGASALIYCTVDGLLKGAPTVAIDRRNRKLIRVARYADHLRLMTPTSFEHLCKTLFLNQGYRVRHVGGQDDGGIDLLVSKDGVRSIVQCKQYARREIGRPALQQLYGAFEDNQAQHAFFVTTGYFSRPAWDFAKRKPITLVDRRMLVLWINEHAHGQIEEPADEPQAVTGDGELVCPDCGTRFTPPFTPQGFAPVYCWDCRRKRKGAA